MEINLGDSTNNDGHLDTIKRSIQEINISSETIDRTGELIRQVEQIVARYKDKLNQNDFAELIETLSKIREATVDIHRAAKDFTKE